MAAPPCSAKQGRRITRVLLDRFAVRDLPPKGASRCYLALGNKGVNANLGLGISFMLIQYASYEFAEARRAVRHNHVQNCQCRLAMIEQVQSLSSVSRG